MAVASDQIANVLHGISERDLPTCGHRSGTEIDEGVSIGPFGVVGVQDNKKGRTSCQ